MFSVKSGNIVESKCGTIEQAALLVSTFFPEDGKIYFGNALVWTEGKDGSAAESYDMTADLVYNRIEKLKAIRAIKNS
jgi:hypothetical protein